MYIEMLNGTSSEYKSWAVLYVNIRNFAPMDIIIVSHIWKDDDIFEF
jgi:hypothetical protein